VDVLGACRVRVDATCVSLPVDNYEWMLDLNDRWKKVVVAAGPASLTQTWSPSDCGSSGDLRFKLKVRRGSAASTAVKTFFITGNALRAPTANEVEVELTTHLALGGRSRGRILLNGGVLREIDGSPVAVRASAGPGKNILVGMVTTSGEEPGYWKFDFGSASNLVPGSLRVVSGAVVALEPRAIVFRLNGQVGERVELSFGLRDR